MSVEEDDNELLAFLNSNNFIYCGVISEYYYQKTIGDYRYILEFDARDNYVLIFIYDESDVKDNFVFQEEYDAIIFLKKVIRREKIKKVLN